MIKIDVIASGSAANCYRVDDGKTALLLECGTTIKKIRQGLKFKLQEVAACLVTHGHSDHSLSAKDIIKAGITVMTSAGTAHELGIADDFNCTILEPMKQKQVGSWLVLPFPVQHDAAEPFGFLLANEEGDKLLFITDAAQIPGTFKGITNLMIEANYCPRILAENSASGRISKAMAGRVLFSHLSIRDVLEFVTAMDKSRLQSIHLLHGSDANSDSAEFRRLVMEAAGVPVTVC